MMFHRLEPVELLRYVDAVGADLNPLVAALADALRGCDEAEVQRLIEEVKRLEKKSAMLKSGAGRTPLQSRAN